MALTTPPKNVDVEKIFKYRNKASCVVFLFVHEGTLGMGDGDNNAAGYKRASSP